jgi:hypothetical protein
MTISSTIQCPACGEMVTITPSIYPGVVNVMPCQCAVEGAGRTTDRGAAAVYNAAMERLQQMYGKHVVPNAVFKPLPPETDRWGYPVDG